MAISIVEFLFFIFRILSGTRVNGLGQETGPTRTIAPVGSGLPPAGSSVTANAFAAIPCGIFVIRWLASPAPGLKTPALMGLPSMGTSHS
jgi:hypothetical protein